jgi:succinate dehydrogenase / fumarate reductase iron-sulfur subunit
VDIEPFFELEKSVNPKDGIVLTEPENQEREHLQTSHERAQFDDDIKCIMCACCVSSCPISQKEDSAYIGPAAIVRAHRYIFDSRVKNKLERLGIMNRPHGAGTCKGYYKCTQVCPKGIQITKHIFEVKRKILQELYQQK